MFLVVYSVFLFGELWMIFWLGFYSLLFLLGGFASCHILFFCQYTLGRLGLLIFFVNYLGCFFFPRKFCLTRFGSFYIFGGKIFGQLEWLSEASFCKWEGDDFCSFACFFFFFWCV